MRRFHAILFAAFYPLAFAAAAADPLGSLIDSEKQQEQKWFDESHEVPPMYLWGDASGVEIDNPRALENSAALCSEVPYELWTSLTEPSATGEVALNTGSSRLRSQLADSCLIRPTDHVLAVGEGWQKEVKLGEFVLRRNANTCADQFPRALWATVSGALPGVPLFFSTNLSLGERPNSFAPAAWTQLRYKNRDSQSLSSVVMNLDEYAISIDSRAASNVDALYFLERHTVTPEDDRLPHHILAWCQGGHCETLWIERVDDKHGSGHINKVGSLDFNGDGKLDLILEGDSGGCAYKKIFMGVVTGFSPMETPVLACRC